MRRSGDGMNEKVRLRGKRRKRKPPINQWLALGSAVCFIVAAVLLVRYARMTASTVKTQQELRAAYQGEEAAPTPLDAAPAATEEAMPFVSFSPPPAALTPPPVFAAATQIPVGAAQTTVQATPEPAMGERFVELYRRNGDIAGWLKIPAVKEIDFPIVHSNDLFYIDHDFYRRKNAGGTAFLDCANSILPRDENLIIHAHNMKNGTMFGKLHTLLNLETLKSSPLLSFDTLYDKGIYAPYAVALVSIEPSSDRYFPLFETNFDSDEARDEYVQALRQFSVFALPVDVINDDELLTLATCHGKEDTERLVVGYRKLRDYEEQEKMENVIRSATVRR